MYLTKAPRQTYKRLTPDQVKSCMPGLIPFIKKPFDNPKVKTNLTPVQIIEDMLDGVYDTWVIFNSEYIPIGVVLGTDKQNEYELNITGALHGAVDISSCIMWFENLASRLNKEKLVAYCNRPGWKRVYGKLGYLEESTDLDGQFIMVKKVA